MAEEQTVLKNTYIKFVSPVPDLRDKRNEEKMKPGYIRISTQDIILMPEEDNKPAEDKAIRINLSDIIDIDRKVELWRKVLGASKILPIHHIKDNEETASIISTSRENAVLFKRVISVLIVNGSSIDFVCPFSRAGKVLLEKQPVKGTIKIKKNLIVIASEWLGKKQEESFDILKLNDFERGQSGGSGSGKSSFTLKYQKDGIIESTLITGENKTTIFLEQYIKILKGISEDEEEIELNEQQFMLLQMMYTSDIDAEMAMGMLGIEMEELEKIVHELVQLKVLKSIGDDEVELTELGTKYIVGQMKKNLGG